MISSLRFLSGYPIKLTGIKKKLFTFNGRLNLIIGPNGSGKSTLLTALAGKTGCGSGGWNDGNKPAASGKDVEIEWDGQPVFYQDCYRNSEDSFIKQDFFTEYSHLRSTGEKRIGLINELINYIEKRFLTYKLKREERPTLLLDEVDNHIGFPGQSILWKEIFPLLIKKYQLIISSHSVFPILLKRDNNLRCDTIIQLYNNYSDLCISELAAAVDYFNSNSSPV